MKRPLPLNNIYRWCFTGYGLDGPGMESRQGQAIHCSPKSSRLALGLTWPHLIGTGGLSWGKSGRGVKLTNDFHLALSLRMSGAIPLLHHYAFMAGTGVTLPLRHTLLIYVSLIRGLAPGPWPFMPLVSSYVNARSIKSELHTFKTHVKQLLAHLS